MAALDDGDTWVNEWAGAITCGMDVKVVPIFESGV